MAATQKQATTRCRISLVFKHQLRWSDFCRELSCCEKHTCGRFWVKDSRLSYHNLATNKIANWLCHGA